MAVRCAKKYKAGGFCVNLKISYKKCSYVLLVFFMLVAIFIIYFSRDIRELGLGVGVFVSGPKFYPIMLGVIMLLVCAASIISVYKMEKDKFFELPNFHIPLILFAILLVWVSLWRLFGYFYLVSAVCMMALLVYLNPEPMSLKKIVKSVLINAVILLVTYLSFTVGLNVSF